MLILERVIGTKIIIDNNIELVLQDVKQDCVFIGVKAPSKSKLHSDRRSASEESGGVKRRFRMLSRYETIDIADNIEVSLLRTKGVETALLGVNAPRHVSVLREEIYGTPRAA